MELIGLMLAVPATLLATCAYVAMLAGVMRFLPKIAGFVAVGSVAALGCVAVEQFYLSSFGAVETYARLGRTYAAIHLVAFFLGPPAIANLVFLAARLLKRSMWTAAIAAGTLCWPASLITVGMNILIDEHIAGVDAGLSFESLPPPPRSLDERGIGLYHAVQMLAQYGPLQTAESAYERLRDAGADAFPVLLVHLEDKRSVPVSVFGGDEMSTDGAINVTLGSVCFGLLQSQIEGDWPKAFRNGYVLTPDNIEAWLARHAGESLAQLQAAAARDELAAVERRIAAEGATPGLQALRAFLQARVAR